MDRHLALQMMRDRNEQLRRWIGANQLLIGKEGQIFQRQGSAKKAPSKKRAASPAASSSSSGSSSRNVRGGPDSGRRESTLPDPTPTRGEAASLTSPASATAAVVDAAAPATSSRASLPCAIQFFLIVCKKILKNPGPACNDIMCLWL